MAPPIDISRFEQLKASGDLPSPKGVALAVMRLIQRDDASMAELARVIRTDPAFVGRLIKAANGLIGYGRRPMSSVQDALTILGMPAVRSMALGFSLLTNYRSGACSSFDYERYWSASLMSAVTTQALTVRTRVASPDELYCLGLLSRVGELALATLFPTDYSRLLDECRGQTRGALLAAENKAFAMNHAELGAAMLADWGLPRVYTDAVHHAAWDEAGKLTLDSREHTLTQSIIISRSVSELCLCADAERPRCTRLMLQEGSRLGFDESQMSALYDEAVHEWGDWASLLSVKSAPMPPFVHLEVSADAEVSVMPDGISIGGDEGTEGASAELTEYAESTPAPMIRVLLAQADILSRQKLANMLLSSSYEVAEVGDGFMATEIALDFQPEILIVDWNLPDIPCATLIKSLRATRIGRGIYVLVMVDENDTELTVQTFEAGADGVISKPFNERLMLARVSAARRQASLQGEIEEDREEIRHFAAELAVSNRRLQEAAMMDMLTGFPNRRFFTQRLQQEWLSCVRSGKPLSCLMIDIDRFKSINDSHGHDVGDRVLQRVSNAIRQGLRSQDVVARTGGDEFMVLCPDTSLSAAMICAERVGQSVGAVALQLESEVLHVSVSTGVAVRSPELLDPEALVKCADQGLYAAKAAGRNGFFSIQKDILNNDLQ